jgi:hypothetical protein
MCEDIEEKKLVEKKRASYQPFLCLLMTTLAEQRIGGVDFELTA